MCVTLCVIGIATAASAAYVPIEAEVKQRHLHRVYTQGVDDGTIRKPWAYSDLEIAGKLVHPRLRQSAVILASGTEEALRAGPALEPNSPGIGEAGTSIIAAHRETHFAFLKHVRVGDKIVAAGTDGKMRDYRVTKTEVIESDALAIAVGLRENRLILYTCYPFESQYPGSERFVVHAHLTE